MNNQSQLSLERCEQIERELMFAKERPNTFLTLRASEIRQERALEAFTQGRTTTQQLAQRSEELEKELRTITLLSVEELAFALSVAGSSEEEKDICLQEQTPYYERAIQAGLQARFRVTFYTTQDRVVLVPAIQVKFPDHMLDRRARKVMQHIFAT